MFCSKDVVLQGWIQRCCVREVLCSNGVVLQGWIQRCRVTGVDTEVRHMLEEKVGYTAQQLTYIVLLRQQLDNSKQSNEKLKRNLSDVRDQLMACQR